MPDVSMGIWKRQPNCLLSLIEARRGNLVIARAVTEWKANGRENLVAFFLERSFLQSKQHRL